MVPETIKYIQMVEQCKGCTRETGYCPNCLPYGSDEHKRDLPSVKTIMVEYDTFIKDLANSEDFLRHLCNSEHLVEYIVNDSEFVDKFLERISEKVEPGS